MARTTEYLSPSDLADELGVPVKTVYIWLHKGVAPRSYKLGRHRRFKRVDVDSWLEERADHPTAAA